MVSKPEPVTSRETHATMQAQLDALLLFWRAARIPEAAMAALLTINAEKIIINQGNHMSAAKYMSYRATELADRHFEILQKQKKGT